MDVKSFIVQAPGLSLYVDYGLWSLWFQNIFSEKFKFLEKLQKRQNVSFVLLFVDAAEIVIVGAEHRFVDAKVDAIDVRVDGSVVVEECRMLDVGWVLPKDGTLKVETSQT